MLSISTVAFCFIPSNSDPATSRKSLSITERSVSPSANNFGESPRRISRAFPPSTPSLKIRASEFSGIVYFGFMLNSIITISDLAGS